MYRYMNKRKTSDRAAPTAQEAVPSRSEMLHLSGAGAPQPMSPQLREKFEPGFSADFSNIRISRGRIPEEMGVQAVAQGTDILLETAFSITGGDYGFESLTVQVADGVDINSFVTTTGSFFASQKGTAYVGVPTITSISHFSASLRILSIHAKSNLPSSGSSVLHVDSATRTVLIPAFFIISKSFSILSYGIYSG